MAEMSKVEMLAYIAKLEAEKKALEDAKASKGKPVFGQSNPVMVNGQSIPNDHFNIWPKGKAGRCVSLTIDGLEVVKANIAAWLDEAKAAKAAGKLPNEEQAKVLKEHRASSRKAAMEAYKASKG